MPSGVRVFIEIGCTKCNCKLTVLCICTDRRQMMGINGIKGYGDHLNKVFTLKMRHSKVMASFTSATSSTASSAFSYSFHNLDVSLTTGASVISLQMLIVHVSSALLETQVNVRSSKILSHSSLSFCTSRILLLSTCCITTPNSK